MQFIPSNRLLVLKKSPIARIQINARCRILKCDPRPPLTEWIGKITTVQ